jgi:hypothetical protein
MNPGPTEKSSGPVPDPDPRKIKNADPGPDPNPVGSRHARSSLLYGGHCSNDCPRIEIDFLNLLTISIDFSFLWKMIFFENQIEFL